MSDWRQAEGWREEQWRAEFESKWPGVKSWPGKEEPVKSIASALVKAQREFGPALKTNTNPHFRSKYADLSACVEAVIDALNNNGIALIQKTHKDDSGVTVETVFVHESGEMLDCGVLHVPASKNDPQGFGSALTYARRYSLMAACGIAPEDDDGNAASKAKNGAGAAIPASVKHTPTDGPVDVSGDRQTLIQLAASVAAEAFKAGEKDAAYDKVEEFTRDNEEHLYLQQVLKPNAALRAYIKFRREQAQKRTTQPEEAQA